MSIDIVAAMDDPDLFGPWFAGPSWDGWRAILKGAFALPMTPAEIEFFKIVAERDPPKKRVRELWISAGRRGGKDSVASVIVAHAAALFDGAANLRPGERPLCVALACDRDQARIVIGYTRSYFDGIPALAEMVTRATATGFELDNGVDIAVGTNSFRAVRGRPILAAIFDEVAFWRDDESALPDEETYRAILPGMATMPGAMLIGISSPYRKAGLLWKKFKAHFGKDGDVLVIKAPSLLLNPTLDPQIVERALEDDPEAAKAEWLAEFRSDIAAFLSAELVETAIEPGVSVRPPQAGIRYVGFADAASGVGKDSLTLGIAHAEQDVAVLDLAHEIKPPFNPQTAIAEACALLKEYRLSEVTGDRYAAGFVIEAFRKNGIEYRYSERDRSAIYLETLPLFTSGRARLLDNKRIVSQFAALERRTARSGKDTIDHPPGAHDDLANAVAGVLANVSTRKLSMMDVL